MRAKAETFAEYHDEHARYGGASQDFHALAATFLRSLAEQHDAARARVAALEKAEAERATPSDWPCLDCQPESKEKANIKTLVAELVTALEGLFVEYDYLCSEGSRYALRLGRVPDHACAECMPDGGPMVESGFRCREHAARAALAKAKGAAS